MFAGSLALLGQQSLMTADNYYEENPETSESLKILWGDAQPGIHHV